MTQTLKKIALADHQPSIESAELISQHYLQFVSDVEVTCTIRLGTVSMTIAELQQLKQGQILSLDQKTHAPIDILLNNHVIAQGELVACDEYFAIKITRMGAS